MRIETAYIACTHANELASLPTYMLLDDHPQSHLFFEEVNPGDETAIPGVTPILAHPAALLAGRGLLRYLDMTASSQLQDHYGLENPWDPQDQAANYTLDELQNYISAEHAVVLDSHNNVTPGLRFARIGSVASRRSIAAANIVGGFTDFVVRDDSFSDHVETGVVLEESAPGGLPDYITIAQRHYAGLYRLAGESPESLDDHYATISSALRFYRMIEIPTYAADGQYADYLPSLERITVTRAYTPIDVPKAVRQQFELGDSKLLTATWGHDTMSPVIDSSGRKLYFGSLLCEIGPLIAYGGIWVKQPEIAHRWATQHYDAGLYNLSRKGYEVLKTSGSRLHADTMATLDNVLADIIQETARA